MSRNRENQKSYPSHLRGVVDGPRPETREKILAALAEGPATHSAIARRAGLYRTTARSALVWMQANGYPISNEGGTWTLAGTAPKRRRPRPYGERGASRGPKPDTREQVAAALDQGPATARVLASRTELNRQTVDLTLRYMRDRGEVARWYVPGSDGLVAGWARDMPEGAPRSSEEAILQAGRAWRTSKQIRQLVDMEPNHTRSVLGRLVAAGRMKRSRGFYRTVDN